MLAPSPNLGSMVSGRAAQNRIVSGVVEEGVEHRSLVLTAQDGTTYQVGSVPGLRAGMRVELVGRALTDMMTTAQQGTPFAADRVTFLDERDEPRRPELWLLRHGETQWSLEHKHTGNTDLELTAEGEEAARAMVDRLAGTAFDAVLTSPLLRASRTAELAGFADAQVVAESVEWDYGDIEGVTTEEVRRTGPADWTVWTHEFTGGESLRQVGRRADAVIARVRSTVPERALLVGHGHFLRILTARWLGRPSADGALYKLGTAGISVLGWEREQPVITRWNA